MDASILQKILDGFQLALAPGMGQFKTFLILLMSAFLFLDLCYLFILCVFTNAGARHAVVLVLKLTIAVPLFLAPGFPVILGLGIDWSVQAGLALGGNVLELRQFMDPGLLLQKGIETGRVLKDLATANSAWYQINFFLPYLGAWIIFVLAYAVMACNVFWIQIEIVIAMPLLLLASTMLFWPPLRHLAGGVISYGVKVWARFFMEAMLASLVWQLAPILAPPIPPGSPFDAAIEQALIIVIAAVVIAILFLGTPFLVTRILSGHTSMHTLGALQTTVGMITMVSALHALAHSAGSALMPNQGIPALRGGGAGGETPAFGYVEFAQPSLAPPPPATGQTHQALREGGQLLLPEGRQS